ncbi:hypothetical protein OAF39_02535, partial [Akkermansiaceae bacterium]|nr:hypothetical protein [Akkermansiaceae bacterium]
MANSLDSPLISGNLDSLVCLPIHPSILFSGLVETKRSRRLPSLKHESHLKDSIHPPASRMERMTNTLN